MQDPTECQHDQACRTIDKVNGATTYGYGCYVCGLRIMAGTWEDARVMFWLRAEKVWVRRLVERRTNGEKLTEREKLMIGHSQFGDAHSHNF